MKMFVLLILITMFSCQEKNQNEPKKDILISDINIIDVRTGTIHSNQYVVVDSGKIHAIETQPLDATKFRKHISGNGGFLMPGLAEMHAHIPSPPTSAERIEETLFLYLSNGITTIRGMLGHPEHLVLRQASEKGELLSPRIFTSSPSLNGNTVQTVDEAVTKVRQYQEDGYDFLKIHPGIRLEVFNALVKTARETGITFSGHVPVDVGIVHALESRYASIDHIDGYLEGLVPKSANVQADKNGFFGYNFTYLADEDNIDELVRLTKSNKVWIVPTQSLFERWFAPVKADVLLSQSEMRYMPKSTLTEWKKRKISSTGPDSGFNEDQWKQFITIRRHLLKALQDGGNGILLGSDAPQLFNVPGFSIHHEIEAMLEAGLTPLQILQSGTIAPAAFLEQEQVFGEIKEEMSADFILLDNNPLEDLKALRNPKGVMVKGTWISKGEIEKKLEEIAINAKKN